jgi:hypothetical protein
VNIDTDMDTDLGDGSGGDAGSIGEIKDIRKLTQAQLMHLGMAHLAYVKPVWMDGSTHFAIYAADGSPMAVAEDCGGRHRAARDGAGDGALRMVH